MGAMASREGSRGPVESTAEPVEQVNLALKPHLLDGLAGTGIECSEPTREPRIGLRARLVALDVAMVAASWVVLVLLDSTPRSRWFAVIPPVVSAVVAVAMTAAAHLYRARVSTNRATELARLGPVAVVAVLAGAGAALVMGQDLTLLAAVLLVGLMFLFLLFGRSAFDGWARGQREAGRFCRTVVIVGTSDEATRLAELIEVHPQFGYRIAGFVGPYRQIDGPDAGHGWLGTVDDLSDVLSRAKATGVVIASDALASSEVNRLVRQLVAAGVHIHLSGGLWGVDHRRVKTVPIAHEPLLYVEPPHFGLVQAVMKRSLDLLVASLLLVLTAPVVLVTAAVVRLSDGGPALFRQERVGRNGQEFVLLKLRTMSVDAEESLSDLAGSNDRQGPLFKVADDPRVTKLGSVLRATSIDELPQLLNVIRGDMSLVGPRPALPAEVEQFDEELRDRDRVRPGITGMWQVEARESPSFEEYRRLDLFYVENWSVVLDVVLLVLTVEVVLWRGYRALRWHQADGVGRFGPPSSVS